MIPETSSQWILINIWYLICFFFKNIFSYLKDSSKPLIHSSIIQMPGAPCRSHVNVRNFITWLICLLPKSLERRKLQSRTEIKHWTQIPIWDTGNPRDSSSIQSNSCLKPHFHIIIKMLISTKYLLSFNFCITFSSYI